MPHKKSHFTSYYRPIMPHDKYLFFIDLDGQNFKTATLNHFSKDHIFILHLQFVIQSYYRKTIFLEYFLRFAEN